MRHTLIQDFLWPSPNLTLFAWYLISFLYVCQSNPWILKSSHTKPIILWTVISFLSVPYYVLVSHLTIFYIFIPSSNVTSFPVKEVFSSVSVLFSHSFPTSIIATALYLCTREALWHGVQEWSFGVSKS